MIGRTNSGTGGGGNGFPEFTYTGAYTFVDEGNKNWSIKFTSSGTLSFSRLNGAKKGVDLFLVGGGGGGGHTSGGGGGGGYTDSAEALYPAENVDYPVEVGDGGSTAARGGTSSVFGHSAAGGYGGANGFAAGGSGGSGGGGGAGDTNQAGHGGSDGENGVKNKGATVGIGQGTSTRAFWPIDQDTSATLYSGGGGGGAGNGSGGAGGSGGGGNGNKAKNKGGNGTANTGGGGGGSGNTYTSAGGNGGSGIVILRNHVRYS